MTPEQEARFEALILEAKAHSKGWHEQSDNQLVCANGRCVLGVLLVARGVTIDQFNAAVKRSAEPLDTQAFYSELPNLPSAHATSVTLGEPLEVCSALVSANDGEQGTDDPYAVKIRKLLEARLYVEGEDDVEDNEPDFDTSQL